MSLTDLERPARRFMAALDAGATRLYGWAWNPFHQMGTVAVLMLLVLIGTGLYLLLFYRLGEPAESVARIAADPWFGAWVRTLHRYATDLFVVAAALHALRLFAQARSWGPRTVAWLSGLFTLFVGLLCAWTGFVMAWDSFGARLAIEGARLLDALPVFSEPLGRIFSGDGPIPSAFFFVNLFLHIVVPLGMGAGLWLHVSKVERPVLLPPRAMRWAMLGALVVASVALPAALGSGANAFTLPADTPLDLFTAWWLPLSERVPALVTWVVVLGVSLFVVLVPWLTQRPREGSWSVSKVDPRLCTGCNQCPQDCPWGAITMVKRDDDRPTLVALVDPSLCVSCGICAGSCAPMGVGPAGHSGRDQMHELRAAVLPSMASTTQTVAVCCEQAPATHKAALRARGAHVHTVPCVGNLHSSVTELFVRSGAPGVIVFGCPPRDCVGREGPKWLHERMFNDREAELQPRVPRERVGIATSAPGDLAGVLAAYDAFAARVAALSVPKVEAGAEVEVECTPVPFEEATT